MAQITSTNRIFKTVILKSGESFTLPPDGEIVFTSDSTSLDSDCSLPPTEQYSCYRFSFGFSATNGDDAAIEDDGIPGPTLDYIEISGTQYDINMSITGALSSFVTNIEAAINPGIFKIYSMYRNNFARRTEFGMKVKLFPSLASSLKIKITGLSYTDGLYLIPVLDTDCNCYTGQDFTYCNNPNT